MKEISKEFIEIDGNEYTLFLNRKGIVAYERFCKEELKELEEVGEKYKKTVEIFESTENPVIDDETNPFEGLEDIADDEAEKNEALIRKMYIKLYWIMLYENHKLSLTEVEELYKKAITEYGEEQVKALGDQMVEEVNTMPENVKQENLKNLKALKPKK